MSELARLGRRREVKAEIADELKDYFDRAVEERVRLGVPRDEAVRQAHAEFGNVTVARETAARGGWSGRVVALLHDLGQDVRFATRQYANAPFLTLTMVLILALGIGVNAGLFGVVRSFITSPVPGLPGNDRLMHVQGIAIVPDRKRPVERGISYGEMSEYRGRRDVFERVAGYEMLGDAVVDPGDGHGGLGVSAWFVTSEYFATLGVRPALGPGLPTDSASDRPGAPLVGVLGHALWRNRFGGTDDVIGRTIRVNGAAVTVVGVAPEGFRGASAFSTERAIWLPYGARQPIETSGQRKNFEDRHPNVIATLAPGATVDRATSIVRTIGARYPSPAKGARGPFTEIEPLRATSKRMTMASDVLMGGATMAVATLLVLLITCTNTSSLLVGRALARRREIAVRLALGAPRRRILRQLLTESALLALVGGLLGLLLAFGAVRVAASQVTDFVLTVDSATVAFTVLFALGTSLLFGLTPALHASRSSVSDALKDTSTGTGARSRLQRGFIVAQVAFTQPMLVGLAVILGFMLQAVRARPEFAVAPHVATIRVTVRGLDAMAPFVERVRSLPGVLGVALVGSGGNATVVVHPGDEQPGVVANRNRMTINARAVSPGYFAVMDIPIVRGRDFEPADGAVSATPIIIGDDFARQLWGDANPIGRRLDLADRNPPSPIFMPSPSTASTVGGYVVVGVIDATRAGASDTGEGYRVYSAAAWGQGIIPRLYVRTSGPATDAFPLFLDAARAAMPAAPLPSLSTRAIEQADERSELTQVAAGAAVGGLLMLLLAAIGLYAVVAVGVTQRTREIGLRMALGAQRAVVVRSFLMSGLRLCAVGMAIGLPLSMLALKLILMSQQEISTNPVLIGLVVAGVVLSVATLASLLPARRAARVNPIIALRAD
jgi:predicted permease